MCDFIVTLKRMNYELISVSDDDLNYKKRLANSEYNYNFVLSIRIYILW